MPPDLCFFRFFVRRAFLAPFAILLERDFALHPPDILARPVIKSLANRTLETDEIWLGHERKI